MVWTSYTIAIILWGNLEDQQPNSRNKAIADNRVTGYSTNRYLKVDASFGVSSHAVPGIGKICSSALGPKLS